MLAVRVDHVGGRRRLSGRRRHPRRAVRHARRLLFPHHDPPLHPQHFPVRADRDLARATQAGEPPADIPTPAMVRSQYRLNPGRAARMVRSTYSRYNEAADAGTAERCRLQDDGDHTGADQLTERWGHAAAALDEMHAALDQMLERETDLSRRRAAIRGLTPGGLVEGPGLVVPTVRRFTHRSAKGWVAVTAPARSRRLRPQSSARRHRSPASRSSTHASGDSGDEGPGEPPPPAPTRAEVVGRSFANFEALHGRLDGLGRVARFEALPLAAQTVHYLALLDAERRRRAQEARR